MHNRIDNHATDRLIGHLLLQEVASIAVDQAAVEDIEPSPFGVPLIRDVFAVLERHGYQHGDAEHVGQAVALLQETAETFAGGGQ
ncbi:hypothetical protein N4G69_20265 [Streptomyces mirabilis]|uniref:hypothetical protein n=1 Tax=Streptomyces mirabilis TaxID=68239 RepID=UPI0021BE2159|nr:hypothetical protein [Streptomyces mirabilis]MCT9107941.1 hypothetical protein [Streptomyces mirabilis]